MLFSIHNVRFKYMRFNVLSIVEISIDFPNAADSGNSKMSVVVVRVVIQAIKHNSH